MAGYRRRVGLIRRFLALLHHAVASDPAVPREQLTDLLERLVVGAAPELCVLLAFFTHQNRQPYAPTDECGSGDA